MHKQCSLMLIKDNNMKKKMYNKKIQKLLLVNKMVLSKVQIVATRISAKKSA